MIVLKQINLVCAFLLELVMFTALGYAGYKLSSTMWLKIFLAVLFSALAILAWAVFAAPKSEMRLPFTTRIFFELSLFALTSFLLYLSGKTPQAITLFIVALVSEGIAYYFKE